MNRFLHKHAAAKLDGPPNASGIGNCSKCSATPCSCTRAAAGSSMNLSGIETVQVIQYAGRVVQIAMELFGDTLENSLPQLSNAKSNMPEHGDGAEIYRKFVKPAIVDIPRLAAHYAIRSVFEDTGETSRIYSYSAHRTEFNRSETGKMKLATGMAQFTSCITREWPALPLARFILVITM